MAKAYAQMLNVHKYLLLLPHAMDYHAHQTALVILTIVIHRLNVQQLNVLTEIVMESHALIIRSAFQVIVTQTVTSVHKNNA